MRRAGLLVGRDPRADARVGARRPEHAPSSTRSPSGTSATDGGDPVVPRLPVDRGDRLPGDAVHLGQRRGGARHPGRARAASTATWSRSTAARSSTAGTATRPSSSGRRRRAAAEDLALIESTAALDVARHRRACRSAAGSTTWARAVEDYVDGLGGRPRRATASSRSTSGTASARSMHEDPQVPNYRVRGRGPEARRRAVRGRRADADRRLAADPHARRRLDRRDRRRPPGRAQRALGRA